MIEYTNILYCTCVNTCLMLQYYCTKKVDILYCTCVNTCLMLQHYCTQKVDTEDVNRSGLLSPSASTMSACFATPVSTARVLMPAWLPNTMSVCKLHTNRRGPSSGQIAVHKRTSTHTHSQLVAVFASLTCLPQRVLGWGPSWCYTENS